MCVLWFPGPNRLKSHSSGLGPHGASISHFPINKPMRLIKWGNTNPKKEKKKGFNPLPVWDLHHCLFFRGIYTICFFFRKGTLFQHRTPPPTLCSYIAFVLLPTLLLTWLWKGRSYRCTPTFRHNRLCCTRSMPAFQFDEGVVELTIRMSLRPRWANNPHEFCNFILSLHNLSAAQTTHRLIHPHVTTMHSCLQFDKPLSQCTTNQQLTRSHVQTHYTLLFLILTGWEAISTHSATMYQLISFWREALQPPQGPIPIKKKQKAHHGKTTTVAFSLSTWCQSKLCTTFKRNGSSISWPKTGSAFGPTPLLRLLCFPSKFQLEVTISSIHYQNMKY